jgi:hypothetical protein
MSKATRRSMIERRVMRVMRLAKSALELASLEAELMLELGLARCLSDSVQKLYETREAIREQQDHPGTEAEQH